MTGSGAYANRTGYLALPGETHRRSTKASRGPRERCRHGRLRKPLRPGAKSAELASLRSDVWTSRRLCVAVQRGTITAASGPRPANVGFLLMRVGRTRRYGSDRTDSNRLRMSATSASRRFRRWSLHPRSCRRQIRRHPVRFDDRLCPLPEANRSNFSSDKQPALTRSRPKQVQRRWFVRQSL